ncbi:LacI family DNA-binding transcriptional regulator [Gracilimonas mengyeensis]|uniref:Transcriptional regulator, LacI family n=1 Tax=Gracilimonas mengyeensis TaxID=1302730 RepID=A0A521EXS8_9BACT|nr:LacI family DNA-binding transcriptional regulator [Gracilimonas mengyeensis]SMO88693.1 transcriptional regulator, LacI family [Gracilimonas mengyeensis]
MKVTLKDIAEKSGYSISTVSRVLNGSGNISTEVQKQIIKIAEELSYPFSKSKIPIYSSGSLHIALVTDFREGEFYASFFYGFSVAARETNVQLSLIDVVDHEDHLIKTINDLDEQIIDGLCLFMPEMNQEDYHNLLNNIVSDLPMVSNAMIQSPVVPTITFDGYSGGHLAAEHFITKGYSSFGIVKGPFEKAESRFRYNGFKDYLAQSGYELSWETTGDFMFDSGVNAYQQYKELNNRPKAVFVTNDLMTKGFLEAAKNDGLQVPKDLALISYDNTPMCRESYPPITAVNTSFSELGKETFKVLKDIIAKKHTQNGTLSLIPVDLVERETA